MAAKYSVGIDPGWKNLGLAIVKEDENGLTLVHSETLNPAELGGVYAAVRHIEKAVWNTIAEDEGDQHDLVGVTIERYVSYNNVLTGESENIVMLIGALIYAFSSFPAGNVPTLYRAIDWKSTLVKLLVKNRGFDNPSQSLDKKFSVAAAHACLDVKGEFSNDHEGDAVCLASISLLEARYAAKRKVA